MRNVSDKRWRENQKTHFMFNTFFYRALYRMLKNTVEPDRPQMTWRMRLACWIPEATNTHSDYVIINVFPPLQWSQECTSMLCYT